METKKFLTIEEVAAEFGLDADGLKQFVDSGEVRALADRGTWKYRRDELQALVDAGRIAPPSAELWLDEGSSADNPVLTVGNQADDDLSYIELDEEALAEHATMITKSNPMEDRTPADEVTIADDWFVPSDADEMKIQPTNPMNSSSDVIAAPGMVEMGSDSDVRMAEGAKISESVLDADDTAKKEDSDSDVRLADSSDKLAAGGALAGAVPDSDSDVRIADEPTAALPEGSGIVLDFDLGAGATVSSSGSSLRLPQTTDLDDSSALDEDESDDAAWDVSGDSVTASTGDSGISLADVTSSAGDSGVNLGAEDSGLRLFSFDESGIALDSGSQIGLPGGGSSVVAGGSGKLSGIDDSGLSLQAADDSGLSLEPANADSGLALEGDEGSVFENDSGLSLEAHDSGLSLETHDSGLSLESAGDSGISLDKTVADDEFAATFLFDNDADKTQTLDLANDIDDGSAFDMDLSDTGATAELRIDDDDADELSATVIKKGRGTEGPGLTESFRIDDPLEVEDLEISADLDEGIEDEVAEAEEEEVFEASDETFGDEVEATDDDEDYLAEAAGAAAAAKAAGPREPSWGAGMAIGLIACSLVLAANGLVLWAGVSTMWNGAEPAGPASALISQLAGLF